MKTKSFLFTLITGIIFNSHAFGQASGNELLSAIKTDTLSMQNENALTALDDTSKVIIDLPAVQENHPEESQLSDQERKAVRVVAVVFTVIGTGATIGILAVRSLLSDLNNIKITRSW